MTSSQAPWIFKLAKHLDWPEKILLLALAIGAILAAVKINASMIIIISLIGLAVVFFLRAYSPIDIRERPDEIFDFGALLSLTILPKVMWISSSVMAVGIAFWWSDFKGYEQLLFIGSSSMFVALVLFLFSLTKGTKYLIVMKPILLRAIPLALVSVLIMVTQSQVLS